MRGKEREKRVSGWVKGRSGEAGERKGIKYHCPKAGRSS